MSETKTKINNRGEKNPNSKLSKVQVIIIKLLIRKAKRADKIKHGFYKELANRFGVSNSTIYKINKRIRWRND